MEARLIGDTDSMARNSFEVGQVVRTTMQVGHLPSGTEGIITELFGAEQVSVLFAPHDLTTVYLQCVEPVR